VTAPRRPARSDKAALSGLARLGLEEPWQCVLHLPLRYEDESRVTPIGALVAGQHALTEGHLVHGEVRLRPRRQWVGRVRDERGDELTARLIHFSQAQLAALRAGSWLRLYGEVRGGLFGREMVHPRMRISEPGAPTRPGLTAVYPTLAGVAQSTIRRAVAAAFAALDWADTVDPETRERFGLCGLRESLARLHYATTVPAAEDPAWQRVRFDELLAQRLSLSLARRARSALSAAPLTSSPGHRVELLLRTLPFPLTGAQQRAWGQIASDLTRTVPMQRLLQGDVGAGKTIVAAMACLRAVENGRQAAVMAPTELLAEQHLAKFRQWLEPLGVRVAGLSGGLRKAGRESLSAAVAAGEVDVLVGTHALFQSFIAEQGEAFPARNHYLSGGDVGALINVAGVGVLNTSRRTQAAEAFVAYLLSAEAQQYFSDSTYEYPVVAGIGANPALVPLADIETPDIDLNDLADLAGTLKLLQDTGVLP